MSKDLPDIFAAYKPLGISPLDLIKQRFSDTGKMAYAGRLDPMAEGVVLLLKGEELKNIHKHLKHDKTYTGKMIFGLSSDTGDILGVPRKEKKVVGSIEKTLKEMEGRFIFTIPPFSGYIVRGKPLFWWARQGRLAEVSLPRKEVSLYSVSAQVSYIKGEELRKEIERRVDLVKGDFRQKKIKEEWNSLLSDKEEFPVASFKIECSSGCYIRSVAEEAGKKLSSGGLLLELTRTKVGDYAVENCY